MSHSYFVPYVIMSCGGGSRTIPVHSLGMSIVCWRSPMMMILAWVSVLRIASVTFMIWVFRFLGSSVL